MVKGDAIFLQVWGWLVSPDHVAARGREDNQVWRHLVWSHFRCHICVYVVCVCVHVFIGVCVCVYVCMHICVCVCWIVLGMCSVCGVLQVFILIVIETGGLEFTSWA